MKNGIYLVIMLVLLTICNFFFKDSVVLSETINVGNIIKFGHYEQDGKSSNGNEEIEWIVLDVQKGKSLIISKYVLDAQPFNIEKEVKSWGECSLRSWLNNDFFNTAFSKDEQDSILITTVDNSKSQGYRNWDIQHSSNTEDHVFLLSHVEAYKYFITDPDRNCTATTHAKKQGVNISAKGFCPWWLRSPGESDSALIECIYIGGWGRWEERIDSTTMGVRPAMWINHVGMYEDKIQDTQAEIAFTEPPESQKEILIHGTKCILKKGDIVKYGHYEQDNESKNGKEPIEWQVLDVIGDRALLLSKYGLDQQKYNNKYKKVTWETCSLRSWLNKTFLKNAFTKDEQSAILASEIDNSKKQGNPEYYETNSGRNTTDKIFCLSYYETYKYLSPGIDDILDDICTATPYTVAKIVKLVKEYPYKNNDCTWWLRSPGVDQYDASRADYSCGGAVVHSKWIAVRPAMWVDLENIQLY